jgi:hypothetical protein
MTSRSLDLTSTQLTSFMHGATTIYIDPRWVATFIHALLRESKLVRSRERKNVRGPCKFIQKHCRYSGDPSCYNIIDSAWDSIIDFWFLHSKSLFGSWAPASNIFLKNETHILELLKYLKKNPDIVSDVT